MVVFINVKVPITRLRKSKPLQALVDNIFMKAQNLGYFEGTDPFVLKKSILIYQEKRKLLFHTLTHKETRDCV